MASVCKDPGGRKRIIFINPEGKRKAIRLGKVSQRLADEIKVKVEHIVAAAVGGFSLDRETAEWLDKIGQDLHRKLSNVGLVASRQPRSAGELEAFLSAYITQRTDVKPNTVRNLEACKARLVEHFGAHRALRDITPGDADSFLLWLREKYADGTAGRTVKRAKQFFRAAVRKHLIRENPFGDVKPPSQVNESRKHFIDRDTAAAVLEACPDAEWRLLSALSRYGGLRCPSEHLALTWPDVDWARERFRVTSSKTEHHDSGGVRWVPIFPELRPYLERAFEEAPEGSLYVIRRYRDTNQNLRSQLRRIIRRAGLAPWPKLFHNLRASRETELAKEFPIHVVCAWIGNTERIAAKHYLQVTEDYFTQASGERGAKSGAPNGAQAARNQAQRLAEASGSLSGETQKPRQKAEVLREASPAQGSVPVVGIPPRGLEPLSSG